MFYWKQTTNLSSKSASYTFGNFMQKSKAVTQLYPPQLRVSNHVRVFESCLHVQVHFSAIYALSSAAFL